VSGLSEECRLSYHEDETDPQCCTGCDSYGVSCLCSCHHQSDMTTNAVVCPWCSWGELPTFGTLEPRPPEFCPSCDAPLAAYYRARAEADRIDLSMDELMAAHEVLTRLEQS